MTAPSIEPLRKRGVNGQLYARLPEIEAKLAEISALTREELSVRCAIEDPSPQVIYRASACCICFASIAQRLWTNVPRHFLKL